MQPLARFRQQMQTWLALLLIGLCGRAGMLVAADDAISNLEQEWDSLPVVDQIDGATQAPVFEYPSGASTVTNLLGHSARVLTPGDTPKVMAWVIGRERGLQAGKAYVLSVEFPDDVPRTIFIANRGADQVRGFSTGSAAGDARRQYTQPSLESLNYPQAGQWLKYRSLFFLHERLQGMQAQRDSRKGGRPFTPADGFQIAVFQSHRLNDPRSQGAAIGRIRLHAVSSLDRWLNPVEFPPGDLPRRRVFFREEMGDEPISGREAADRAVADPVQWFVWKAQAARVLGFNTFAKDLLEFGFNQGWDSGDQNWVMNAQPPLSDLWQRLAPRLAAEGLDLLPYFEYKGALGLGNAKAPSLGWQRRAEKLYHGHPNTNYTGTWWVEQHNADLTDPATLDDARRLLDRTIIALRDKASFAGAWFRTRQNHLPISFAPDALQRFRAASANEKLQISRELLIASYEGDRKLYDRYLAWWLEQRRLFLTRLQQHLADKLGNPQAQLLFTPWISETIPMLRDPGSGKSGHPVQIVTDSPEWWDALARTQPNSGWWRWALVPTRFDTVVKGNYYQHSLEFREAISPLPWRTESDHAAPNADPERYRHQGAVMMTYPIGRLFSVARPDLLEQYRTEAGLTVVRHYPLNEDNAKDEIGPFGGKLGYTCVDVDRAGPFIRLEEARAVAFGDPRNIGYLSGSVFSCGFPQYVRQFNQAFLSVPALPSTVVSNATTDREVIVRQIPAGKHGTYFFVVNTSMDSKKAVVVRLPGSGGRRDLVAHRDLPSGDLALDLRPGELRSYLAPPAATEGPPVSPLPGLPR